MASGSAHLLDGRVAHVVLLELFTDSGIGTMITRSIGATLMSGPGPDRRPAGPGPVHPPVPSVPEGRDHCPFWPTYGPPSRQFVRGRGTEIWDSAGRRYLDFLGGLAVVALGHAHPEVAEAIAAQAGTLLHTSNLFATVPGAEVAVTIDELLGGGGQVFLCNSGAEANEAAIKLARRWGGRGRTWW